jgi:hypothetical protein
MLSEMHLNDAIRSLKSNLRSEALSEASRARIFDAARQPLGRFEALAFLFPQARTVAAALAFPLVLTMALLLSLPSPIAPGRQAKIVATKNGENVVFTVANGHKEHRVFKSTDPTRFGVKEVPEVGGRFSDRADNGVELVFYRVD